MKIAISGTHSTGKTTFIRKVTDELEKNGIGYIKISDLAVKCPLPILTEHTVESTLWIASKGMLDEIEAEHTSQIVIVDRPILDCWGYFQAVCKDKYSSDYPKLLALVSMIKHWSYTYDIIYQTMLDESIPIENTKERILDEDYRKQVDIEMKLGYKHFGVEPLELTVSNSEQRLVELISIIQKR